MPNDTLRTPDDDARAQHILDAAAELFAHYGYDKTTVRDIAEAAGVYKAAIYLYWDSKEALFEVLVRREIGRYMEMMLQSIRTDPETSITRVFLNGLMVGFSANPFIQALIREDRRVLGKYLHRWNTNTFGLRYELYHHALTELQNAGAIRAHIDPAGIAYIMTAISYGILNMGEPPGAPPYEVIVAQLGELFVPALESGAAGDNATARQVLIEAVEATKVHLSIPP